VALLPPQHFCLDFLWISCSYPKNQELRGRAAVVVRMMRGCGLALLLRWMMAYWSPAIPKPIQKTIRRKVRLCRAAAGCSGGWLIRFAGPPLAISGLTLTFWCTGLHLFAVLPHFVGPRPHESLTGLCHLLLCLFFGHGGLSNYFLVSPSSLLCSALLCSALLLLFFLWSLSVLVA